MLKSQLKSLWTVLWIGEIHSPELVSHIYLQTFQQRRFNKFSYLSFFSEKTTPYYYY